MDESQIKKEFEGTEISGVSDSGSGKEVLAKMKKIKGGVKDGVIYGVYDNSHSSLFTRFNDFLIDHSGISLKEKSYFFHMLAVMVDAGIPVVQAVKSLADKTANNHFARVLATLAYACEHGASLYQAMMRFENVFEEAEVGIVRSGEATGRLAQMLFRLSEQLEKRYEIKMKFIGAAIYPVIVVLALIAVTALMLIWVFPTLLNVLSQGGVSEESLPWATRFLIGLNSVLTNYWWLILLVIFGLYGIINVYIGTSFGAVRWDYFKLRFPVVGGLLKKMYTLNFVSMLGLLIDSGVPVLDSLKIIGNSLKNRIYKLKMQELIDGVKNGQKISENLRDSEFLFSPEVTEMIGTGEASANLGKISIKISTQYEKEIDSSLNRLTSIFGPVMILFIGVFVALIALAIMMPIFNLGTISGV